MSIFLKYVSAIEKFSGNGRNYSQCMSMEQEGDSKRFVFTDGYFISVLTIRQQETTPVKVKTIIPVDDDCPVVVDYPKYESILSDVRKLPRATDIGMALGAKHFVALSQAKVGQKTTINPATAEISHDGPNPGSILAKYLVAFFPLVKCGLGRNLDYVGKTGDDLHGWVCGGRNWQLEVYAVAQVDSSK
jgi:hypothetical protein